MMDTYDPKMSYSTSVWHINEPLKRIWPFPEGYQVGNMFGIQPDVKTGEQNSAFIGLMENDKRAPNPSSVAYDILLTSYVPVLITTGGWGAPAVPHSIQEIKIYVKALHGSELIAPWVFELFDLLEKHEDECRPYWTDCKPGALYWIKYHEALESIPSNFAAIGDAMMKVNPVYGKKRIISAVHYRLKL